MIPFLSAPRSPRHSDDRPSPGILQYVPRRHLLRAASLTLALGLALTGCSLFESEPPETPTPTPSPTPSSEEPIDPDSPEGRQIEFDRALEDAWDENSPVDRDGYIEALVDAGFDKDDMEATSDTDSLGGTVAQIEISVRLGDTCIVGQAGEEGTHSVLAPPLQNGECLVGNTPPID